MRNGLMSPLGVQESLGCGSAPFWPPPNQPTGVGGRRELIRRVSLHASPGVGGREELLHMPFCSAARGRRRQTFYIWLPGCPTMQGYRRQQITVTKYTYHFGRPTRGRRQTNTLTYTSLDVPPGAGGRQARSLISPWTAPPGAGGTSTFTFASQDVRRCHAEFVVIYCLWFFLCDNLWFTLQFMNTQLVRNTL